MGPIGVKKHLVPFLPAPYLQFLDGNDKNVSVASAPFGSASILAISYSYFMQLGAFGVK